MLALMSKYWWVPLVRGILAILFGLMALAWPALTFTTLVLLFGAWALVSGVTLLAGALGGRVHGQDHWLMLIQGGLGVAVGLMTFFAPGITEVALLLYIAVWAMATGVIEIVSAVRLRHEIEGEGWMILNGLISVLFAFVLMASPASGAMALVTVIGFFALFAGALLVVLGVRLRGMRARMAA
jgi:uncharacterized membrane protein HdeD (DUF308 family)